MKFLKRQLKKIYKASQCLDLNDVEIAIQQTEDLSKEHKNSSAVQRRLKSLMKRENILIYRENKNLGIIIKTNFIGQFYTVTS